MEKNTNDRGATGGNRWRMLYWGTAALLLLLPAIAMQFTDEVNWTGSDFLFASILFGSVGGAFELVVRTTSNSAYRMAAGIALAGALLMIWINGAVGIIGSEDNPANVMYGGVLLVGVLGALVSRFRPAGMSVALFAAAAVTALIAAIAVVGGLGAPYSGPVQLLSLNGFFVSLFAAAGVLFREAAREESERSAA